MCYDFNARRASFLLYADDECAFGRFDVNPRTRRVAVINGPWYGVSKDAAVELYDLDGQCFCKVPVKGHTFFEQVPWFKLLDGALLVAEGNKLKLYEIDVE